MISHDTSKDEASGNALGLALFRVFVPAGIFVFGLIYLVSPTYRPPSQSWANGTYVNACCVPLVLRDGVLTMGSSTARYSVSDGKFGHEIEVPGGIGVRHGKIELGGTFVHVYFNRNSMAAPALKGTEAIHLFNLDDGGNLTFVRRE